MLGQDETVRATKALSSTLPSTRRVLPLLSRSDGFAVDSRSRNFYWTDEARKCIHAASMDGAASMVSWSAIFCNLLHRFDVELYFTLYFCLLIIFDYEMV